MWNVTKYQSISLIAKLYVSTSKCLVLILSMYACVRQTAKQQYATHKAIRKSYFFFLSIRLSIHPYTQHSVVSLYKPPSKRAISLKQKKKKQKQKTQKNISRRIYSKPILCMKHRWQTNISKCNQFCLQLLHVRNNDVQH